MRVAVSLFVASAVSLLPVSPAFAQDTQTPPLAKKALDPNQMICEKQEVVGSRLATEKVCHTRAQWADLRLQDRQGIDKAQTNNWMPEQH